VVVACGTGTAGVAVVVTVSDGGEPSVWFAALGALATSGEGDVLDGGASPARGAPVCAVVGALAELRGGAAPSLGAFAVDCEAPVAAGSALIFLALIAPVRVERPRSDAAVGMDSGKPLAAGAVPPLRAAPDCPDRAVRGSRIDEPPCGECRPNAHPTPRPAIPPTLKAAARPCASLRSRVGKAADHTGDKARVTESEWFG